MATSCSRQIVKHSCGAERITKACALTVLSHGRTFYAFEAGTYAVCTFERMPSLTDMIGKHLLILLEGALQEAYRLFFASSQGVEPLAGGATTAAIGASRTPDIPAMR